MKIILFDHNSAPYPVTGYGGIERVNQNLFECLTDKGVDVEIWINDKNPYSYKEGKVRQLSQSEINDVLSGKTEITGCDVFHSHTSGDHQQFNFAPGVKWSATCHSALGERAYADNLVFVSERQRHLHITQGKASKSQCTTVIHNGIDLLQMAPEEGTHDKYIWFAGIRRDKGAHLLPELAEKAGITIHAFGTVQDYSVYLPMRRSHRVMYYGEVLGDEAKRLMFSQAKCLIHTAIFEEPGAFTIKEAFACGVPVIGLAFGCLPEEVIEPEINLAEDIDGLAQIIKTRKFSMVDQVEARKHAERNFDKWRMAEEYLKWWEGCV